jgi:hypothetical protein
MPYALCRVPLFAKHSVCVQDTVCPSSLGLRGECKAGDCPPLTTPKIHDYAWEQLCRAWGMCTDQALGNEGV